MQASATAACLAFSSVAPALINASYSSEIIVVIGFCSVV